MAILVAIWGQMPFDRTVRRALRRLYSDYANVVAGIIRDGSVSGEFKPSLRADLLAHGMIAPMDGLALHATLGPQSITRHAIQESVWGLLAGVGINKKRLTRRTSQGSPIPQTKRSLQTTEG